MGMKKEYVMPIHLEIDSKNPSLDARRIAETIMDAVEEYGRDFRGQFFDMEYSIYIKAEKEVFATLTEGDGK